MADNNCRSDRGRDPIAELARLIVQAHPDVESAPAESGCRGETAWDGCEVPPELPLAPQLQVYGDAPEQTLLPLAHHDVKSGTPAAKSIPVLVRVQAVETWV
jgi:hypothetical protein